MKSKSRTISEWSMQACNNHPLHILVLACSIFLVYSNAFESPFQLDDLTNIVNNPAIRDFGYFSNISRIESSDMPSALKPLFATRYIGYLTFALNYAFGGLDVRGYHLVNILIHIFNSLLVYRILSLIFMSPFYCSDNRTLSVASERSSFIVLFSAILFAVHPLQTQAVTYIVQRFASLATLFYLLSIAAYLKFRLYGYTAGGRTDLRRAGLYTASLLSAVLAMKTKEFSVSLPIILVLIEVMFLDGSARRRALYLLPFVLSTLLIPLSLIGAGVRVENFDETAAIISRAKDAISRSDYLLTQFRVVVTYIRLLIFPIAQNVDYDYPIHTSFFSFPVIASFVLLLSIFTVGVYLYRLSGRLKTESAYLLRLISFGIFWFFITLAPESGIVPIEDVIFEHRAYLPSAGFFIALTASFELFAGRWGNRVAGARKILLYSLIILAVGLSAATYKRNMVWAEHISLWEDVVMKSPNKARPHNNLGVAYQVKGLADKAVDEYLAALRIKPDFVEAHYNLASIYQVKGLADKAVDEYLAALKIKPDFADAHYNIGYIYGQQNQLDKAIDEFEAALTIRPDFAEAHYYLGYAYANSGRIREAIREFEETLRINPQDMNARRKLEGLGSDMMNMK